MKNAGAESIPPLSSRGGSCGVPGGCGRAAHLGLCGGGIFSYTKTKTSTNYMGFKTYCEDYQPVAKKQGVNGIPPMSSRAGSFGVRGKVFSCQLSSDRQGESTGIGTADEFYYKKAKINTFCMKVMVDITDYQRVRKIEGTKGFPPSSSF